MSWSNSAKTSKNNYSLSLTVTQNSRDDATRTTNVTVVLKLISSSTYFQQYQLIGKIYTTASNTTTNRKSFSQYYSFNSVGSTITLATWTGNVQHDSQGNLTCTFSGAITKSPSASYSCGTGSVGMTVTFPSFATYPTKPTTCTARPYSGTNIKASYERCNRTPIIVSWSGTGGQVTYYTVYRAIKRPQDSAYGSYTRLGLYGNTSGSGTFTDSGVSELPAGTMIRYRVLASNDGYDALDYAYSNIVVIQGGAWVRTSSGYKFGTVWVRTSNGWKRATGVFRKNSSGFGESV